MIVLLLNKERDEVVKFGMSMKNTCLTVGTTGNVSVINHEKKLIAISPSGMEYDEVTPSDVVILDMEGNVVDGNKKPSTEWPMHLIVYRNRGDVGGVVHTHSKFSTTLACLNWELPPVHYMVAFSGEKVPLADYGRFGTTALAEKAWEGLGRYNAVLLANHGLLTAGKDLKTAFKTAEQVEFVAEMYWRSRAVGEPVTLNSDEMQKVREMIGGYGQK